MKSWIPLCCLLCCACQAVRVHYDYDKETDFSAYRTYNYYPDMETGLEGLDTKRLLRATDSVLMARGLMQAEEPDFWVNIVSQSHARPSGNTVGVGIGGTGSHMGGGVSVGIPVGGNTLERRIQFDFVDVQKDALFWQGISEGGFPENASPEARDVHMRKIAEKVLSKYPPKK